MPTPTPRASSHVDTGFILGGNHKLPPSTAVLNLSPAELCSSRILGLCQLRNPNKECYSLKESRTYGCRVCLPNRLKAMNYYARLTAFQIADDLIRINAAKRRKITALRISESGDFFTQVDVDKCENIAAYLTDAGINTYAYTARKDLCYDNCQHLVVNGSGWMAHNRFQVAYDLKQSPRGGWTCLDRNEKEVSVDVLCPGDCSVCSLCQERGGKTIGVRLH